ncbi:MAG TPA: universal stress protein [Ktedonobacterales bacterium]|nr:universal stress protein [Ktedonobacterales bacterium]
MLKRILVPLDGSPFAEAALAPATALAKRFNAGLLLVRTILVHVFPGVDPGPGQLEAFHEAELYIDGVARPIKEKGISVRTAIPYDAPAIGIADQAEFRQVDLVIMSTHARAWPETLLHPSVTMGVLEHTAAPILALKVTEEAGYAPSAQLPRFMTDPQAPIIVPLDGSLRAECALPLAEGLAKVYGNPLLLVRAVEHPRTATASMDYPEVIHSVEEWAIQETQEYLKSKQDEVSSRGARVAIESSVGAPSWFIEECIQAHRAGLVAMASHGRSGLGRFLLGSVAQTVLRQSEGPILLVRPHTELN